MKQRNRILSLILAVLLVVGMLQISAIAADSSETYTLRLVYNHEVYGGATVGTGIDDVVIENIPHGTVVDLSDYWPDELSATGSDEEIYYFFNFLSNPTGGGGYCSYKIESDITLYAGWLEEQGITVTFETNGGSIGYRKAMCSKSYLSTFNFAYVPVRNGYKFLGWSLDDDGTIDNPDIEITTDCTLYAVWEEVHSHCVCGGNTNIGNHTAHPEVEFTPWNKTNVMPTTEGNYVLMNDVTLSNNWEPADGTVLCLNGHILYAHVIDVRQNRKFTLCDCGEGKIAAVDGTSPEMIYLYADSTFNIYGGVISGGNSRRGVCVSNAWFNMYGGYITDNATEENGAGVCLNGIAKMTMYGGTITDNYSTQGTGGGVWSDNTASIKLSGDAVITNNTGKDGANNLHLASDDTTDAKITVGELGSNASVGVSVDSNHGMVISSGGKNYSQYFTADNPNYIVAVDGENMKLVESKPVQVGRVELKGGEYTTDGINRTAGEPTGEGYAYYKNGVLTLNNFTYSGGGNDYAAIYCEYDLTIKIEGNNSITRVVTATDTDTLIVLRGIWVRSGELRIIGDNKEDFLEVNVNGHDNTAAYAVNGNSEGVVIENCTLEAISATGGAGLYVAGEITVVGAEVLGSSGSISVNQDTFGIYAATLKVKDSDVVAVAEDNSYAGANGLWIAGSTGKLIFESGSIVAETSDVSVDSYAVNIASEDVTLPAEYWMRTSASGDFAEGTWDGANIGPYIELTTTQLQNDWVSTPTIRGWIYNTVKSTPQAEAKYGTVEFKYYDADKNLLTELPDNAGTYYLKGFVAETDNYTGLESDYVWFAIEKDEQIPPRPTGVNTTYIDTNDGKITGVDSTMEYRKEGDANYTAVTGTEITGLAPGEYYVRYAEKQNYNPSPEAVIVIAKGGKRTPDVDTNPTASRVIIGGKLSDSTLIGGLASVPGEFAWVNPDAVMNTAGKFDMLVRFTPSSTVTYNTVDFEIEVEVVVCDTANGEHEYTEQKTNADEHWNVCAKCGVEEPDSREAHKGGTSTCTAKAECSECGEAYGAEPSHGETEIRNAKQTSCDEEGYTGDTHCKVCGEKLETGTAIAKTAHNYENGKCTVCDATDPNYVPDSPQTGDNSNMTLWIALLFISGMGVVVTTAMSRKKRQAR